MTAYWWCPECKQEIAAQTVTFQECHEVCGHPAEWIIAEEAGLVETLRAALAQAEDKAMAGALQELVDRICHNFSPDELGDRIMEAVTQAAAALTAPPAPAWIWCPTCGTSAPSGQEVKHKDGCVAAAAPACRCGEYREALIRQGLWGRDDGYFHDGKMYGCNECGASNVYPAPLEHDADCVLVGIDAAAALGQEAK